MKKWIAKAEEKQIIKAYEYYKGEIVPYGDIPHTYEVLTVRKTGNGCLSLIRIMEEQDRLSKSPRILVRHTDSKGFHTFTDVWERDEKGNLYWKFRNPSNVPLSDREAIALYEEEMAVMRREYHKIIDTKHKPAGRRPHPEILDEKARKVHELILKGYKEKEITEMLGIGRATYYRLKRRLNE